MFARTVLYCSKLDVVPAQVLSMTAILLIFPCSRFHGATRYGTTLLVPKTKYVASGCMLGIAKHVDDAFCYLVLPEPQNK